MLLFFVQCITASGFAWLLWPFLRRVLVKSDLDNLPGPPSASWLKGNFYKVFNIDAWNFHREIAKKYGRVVRVNGTLGSKQLYVFDPKALHHMVIKEPLVFDETESWFASWDVLFGKGLLATKGPHHRKQRKMLNPVFSTAHMRQMVPMFFNVTNKLTQTLESKMAHGPQELDIIHWVSRTALELIVQGGLGCSMDPLTEDATIHPFGVAAKDITPVMFHMLFARIYLIGTLVKLGPGWFRRIIVDLLPFKNVKRLRDIVDVMQSTAIDILESKKRALKEGDEALARQVGQGKDIMSILLKANMAAAEEDKLPDSEVLAQMSTLTFAAMDTTSNALSRIFSVLAAHPEAQEKLRQEILDAREKNGDRDFTYDELEALPFLDAVCRETLRLYPPISSVLRTVRKDAVLPLYTPVTGVDGREMHEIVVPKDTLVVMSVMNCNSDSALWGPDSYEWKPERWLSPLPEAIVDAPIPGVYSHLMTFLGGGRACIGFKFSQLEMKVVLSALLSKFRFTPSDKEIVWEMSGIAVPTVKGHPRVPKMPLTVTAL